MAFYSYEYGSRYTTNERESNEVNISSLETQLSDLTSLVVQLVCKELKPVKRSGSCNKNFYPTNRYPTSHFPTKESYSFGGFSSQYQGPYEPYSKAYMQGWQSHPYTNEYDYDRYDSFYPNFESTPPPTQSFSEHSGMSLEDIVRSLATSTLTFQQETSASLQNLEDQIHRMEVQIEEKLGSMIEERLEISLEEEEEEVGTNRSVSRDEDIKGDDVILEPLVVDTWETFTELEEPMVKEEEVFPSDGTFADPQKISSQGKGSILEIRADFKVPQHRVKTHVWDFDLLDPG